MSSVSRDSLKKKKKIVVFQCEDIFALSHIKNAGSQKKGGQDMN